MVRRARGWAAVAVAVPVLLASLGTAACSSDGGSGGGGAATGSTDAAGSATASTLDPLAGPVLDACGNDLAGLTSTVWAVDPATGSVRWSRPVPLASPYLLRDPSGGPRVPLVLRRVDAVLDPATGAVVATPPAGAHEVLVDTTGTAASGVGGLLVDGERQPAAIEAGGVRITTASGTTGQATVALTATNAATAAPAWQVELGPSDSVASISPPVAYGDLVVVVVSPPAPACPAA